MEVLELLERTLHSINLTVDDIIGALVYDIYRGVQTECTTNNWKCIQEFFAGAKPSWTPAVVYVPGHIIVHGEYDGNLGWYVLPATFEVAREVGYKPEFPRPDW